MNKIKIFENSEFGSVRTTSINGEPYFVGKDVATILGYAKPLNALAMHVDEDDSLKQGLIDSMGRTQETIFINESGLYSLILSSKLPTAKKFKHWVTRDVLPAIRKNGGYIAGQESLSDEDLLAKALLVAQNRIVERNKIIKEQDEKLEEQKPKVLFADAVSASNTSILIGDFAKILKQNGINTGQKRLFEWLRENGYLIKRKGSDWNSPTQKSMEMGLFEVKENTVTHYDGHVSITKTTKITGKGQQYFVNKFLG